MATGDTLLTLLYQGQSLSKAVCAASVWASSSAALQTRAQSYGYTMTFVPVSAQAPATGVQVYATLAGIEAWIDQTATQNGQSTAAQQASQQQAAQQDQTTVVVSTPTKLPTAILVGALAGFLIGGISAMQSKEPVGKTLLDAGIGAVTGAAIGQLGAALYQSGVG